MWLAKQCGIGKYHRFTDVFIHANKWLLNEKITIVPHFLNGTNREDFYLGDDIPNVDKCFTFYQNYCYGEKWLDKFGNCLEAKPHKHPRNKVYLNGEYLGFYDWESFAPNTFMNPHKKGYDHHYYFKYKGDKVPFMTTSQGEWVIMRFLAYQHLKI